MGTRFQTEKELKDHLLLVQKTIYDWQGRWTLGLMIANGTGLATITAVILKDVTSPLVYLIFPCVWLFAIGLIAAGSTPAIDIFRFENEIDRVLERLSKLTKGSQHRIAQEFGPITLREAIPMWWVEILSSVAFLAGLIYPMAVLCLRYLSHGNFQGS